MANTATKKFGCNAETWVWPKTSYQPYPNVSSTYRYAEHWYKNHSDVNRWGNCYQGGCWDTSGVYNGNMMSIMKFTSGGQSLRSFINSIGVNKITSIKLKMNCKHTYYSSGATFCFWAGSHAGDVYTGWSTSSPAGLGFTSLTSTNLVKGGWRTIDLTNQKGIIANNEVIAMYKEGAYNVYQYYGYFDKAVELEVTYKTNSAPTVNNVNISGTKDGNGWYKPAIEVSMSASDPDGNLDSKPYAYQIWKDGKVDVEQTWISTSWKTNVSSYRGKTITARGIARDKEGEVGWKDKSFKVNSLPVWNSNPNIYISKGESNSVFLNAITVSWTAAKNNDSGQSISYTLLVSKNGTESVIKSGLTSTSYEVNTSSYGSGTECVFKVYASDGLENNTTLSSKKYYKDSPPAIPTITVKAGHYESTVPITWSKSSGNNGSTVEGYELSAYYSDGTFINKKDFNNSTFSYNYSITGITRGKKLYFKIRAKDNFGIYSSYAQSNTVSRNYAPTKPTNFKINKNIVYCKNNVPLTWTASSDSDKDQIYYVIYYKTNNMQNYQMLKDKITETKYNHNISSLPQGTTIDYYIKAYDSLGAYSDTAYISSKAIVNTNPTAPAINLPMAGRTLYTNKPRIVFTCGKTVSGINMIIKIKVNGTEYTSENNPEYFDKVSYANNSIGVFSVPKELNYSNSNSIEIYAYDGMDTSNIVSKTYGVDYPLTADVEKDETLITAKLINDTRTMINANRFAYGLDLKTWSDGLISKDSPILKKYFDEMQNASFDVNTLLNGKCASNNTKRIYTKDSYVSKEAIKADFYNNINRTILEP